MALGREVVVVGRLLTVGREVPFWVLAEGRAEDEGLWLLLTVGREVVPALPFLLTVAWLGSRELKEPGVLLRRTVATYWLKSL